MGKERKETKYEKRRQKRKMGNENKRQKKTGTNYSKQE